MLYDLNSKVVFRSRDVIFDETCFSFHNSVLPNDSTLPVLPLKFHVNIFYPNALLSSPFLAVNHDNVFNSVPASPVSPTHPVQNGNSASSSSIPISSYSPSAKDFVPRRSTRISHPPMHFQDYVYYGVSSPFASNNFSSPFCISNSFVAYILTDSEPTTYKQAVTDPRCVVAMTKQVDDMSANGT
ncbi:hypothetical protein LIER_43435 [Lithospermum erythrorhizon]|uniref:Uncharacterized protein n=1 Tax=Lithospermum erythrorhizon TaxID=34254 RepID=A0AAV3Q5L3_LITER